MKPVVLTQIVPGKAVEAQLKERYTLLGPYRNAAQQLEAIDARHLEVSNDDIRRLFFHRFERDQSGLEGSYGVWSLQAQRGPKAVSHEAVVVDQVDRRHCLSFSSGSRRRLRAA